jgi:hypothetical protein
MTVVQAQAEHFCTNAASLCFIFEFHCVVLRYQDCSPQTPFHTAVVLYDDITHFVLLFRSIKSCTPASVFVLSAIQSKPPKTVLSDCRYMSETALHCNNAYTSTR